MKTLKLDHQFAEAVRAGKKTFTWRMYDDKDLHVNDEVELIDKVNAHDPATWQSLGIAKIDVLVEKRLGELEQADLDGHDGYESKNHLLADFQKYYGPQVTFDTPVKIIRFSLQRKNDAGSAGISPHLKEAKIYTDGGSRGNPGPSASGFAIMSMDNNIVVRKGIYLGVTTNNQAEYQALKLALEEAKRMNIGVAHVYMDSLLVVNQMLGIFKVKNRDLWPIHDSIKDLITTFQHISFTHVPRELNKVADKMVNEALDQAAAGQ